MFDLFVELFEKRDGKWELKDYTSDRHIYHMELAGKLARKFAQKEKNIRFSYSKTTDSLYWNEAGKGDVIETYTFIIDGTHKYVFTEITYEV